MNRGEKRRLEKLSKKKNSVTVRDKQQLYELATNKLVSGELKQAQKLFTKLIELDPNDPSILHFAGINQYRLGKYTEALQLFDEAITKAPNYAEAYNSKAIVLLQQRKFQEAIDSLKESIKYKPSYDNAYLNLGDALHGLNNIDDAITNYEKALAHNTHNIEATYKLAALSLAKGDIKSSLEYCDYCLQLNPLCQNALAYRALACWADGNRKGWEELYDFDEMIKQFHLDLPGGFSSIDDFNNTLEVDINNHKSLIWEPLERVTNGGAVTSDLLLEPTRAIRLLEKSIKQTVNNFVQTMPSNNEHPFFRTRPKNYKITLIGSILKGHGIHPPHIHENSWLSGVYYVRTPDVMNHSDDSHSGWLQFGKPDITLQDENLLPVAVRFPQPGSLIVFPSYFFHGTIPFRSNGVRVGIAFDIYPVN